MWAGFVGGRTYVRVMSGTAVREALSALLAAHDALAACDFDTLSKAESVEFSDALETLGCRLPTLSHRLLAQLQSVSTAREMGARTWKKVLSVRWRISTGEAGRRLALAKELGPRRALTGQPLEPLLPATAVAGPVCVAVIWIAIARDVWPEGAARIPATSRAASRIRVPR